MTSHDTFQWVIAVESYLRVLTNTFTVLWSCIFLGICVLIIRLYTRQNELVLSRVIRLTFLSLLIGWVTWGLVAASFLPETLSTVKFPENFILPWPSIGLATSFCMFLIFGYLTIRKKSWPVWLKIVLFSPLMILPLLAGGYAGLSTWFVWLLSWPPLPGQLALHFFIFVGYAFCCLVVATTASEFQVLMQEEGDLMSSNEQYPDGCRPEIIKTYSE